MSATFDTLKLADRLQSAGFTSEQARGTAAALSEVLVGDLATRGHVNEARLELKAEISDVKSELRIFRWMMGFLLAFQVAIFIKLFVH